MAIVKCPECGGSISSNATKCVHCGCDVTYCDECESVIVGKVDVCSNCGNVLSVSQSTLGGSSIECKDIDDAVSKWRSEKIIRSVLGYALLPYIIFFIGLALWVIALIITFTFSGSATDVEKYTSTVNSVKTLLGIGIGTYVLFVFFNEFRELWMQMDFAKWAIRNDINLNEMLKKDLSNDFKTLTFERKIDLISGIATGVSALLYQTNAELKTEYVKRILLRGCLLGLASVLFGAFLIDNSEVYISYRLLYSDMSNFSFEMIVNLWCVIVGAILVVADLIINKKFFNNLEKEYPKTWVKQNLPEYYDVYIKNSVDKVLDEGFDGKSYKF